LSTAYLFNLSPLPKISKNAVWKRENQAYLCAPLIEKAMAVTRLKRKNRKDKAKSAVRRQTLKIQNFQPVMKTVDVEKIKEEFKAKAKAPKKA
jgi:hypothetical protein